MVENELTELSGKIDLISTKGLIKDLINTYRILYGAKYFFQAFYKVIQYLYELINTLIFLVAPKKFILGNLKEYQNY